MCPHLTSRAHTHLAEALDGRSAAPGGAHHEGRLGEGIHRVHQLVSERVGEVLFCGGDLTDRWCARSESSQLPPQHVYNIP